MGWSLPIHTRGYLGTFKTEDCAIWIGDDESNVAMRYQKLVLLTLSVALSNSDYGEKLRSRVEGCAIEKLPVLDVVAYEMVSEFDEGFLGKVHTPSVWFFEWHEITSICAV